MFKVKTFKNKISKIDSDSDRKGYQITDTLWRKLACLFDMNKKAKTGEEYRSALLSVLKSKNRCDIPVTMEEIWAGVSIEQMQKKYVQYRDFKRCCRLNFVPYKIVENKLLNGNLCIKEIFNENLLYQYCSVYLLVEPNTGIILKIGRTDETFNDRLGTYGNGRVHLRLAGSGSVTNYWVTQSIACNSIECDVYILEIEKRPNYESSWYGEKISTEQNAISAMESRAKEAKAIELYQREQLMGYPPCLNIQKGKK